MHNNKTLQYWQNVLSASMTTYGVVQKMRPFDC